ncbi:STAS domain-containing protein [Nocardioides sp. cx-173]|uniref:STAS domain-containing protein n=1 Tax=Nocardioides sp. cx-173 TaxID=2898796 RepID=UPI001E4F244D|nr:STAS domain-containing protein [Nocardioides sp. cx-173]MCD4523346.1 STAS domain-containing protein [Nocardioides sp. cx-173]UGB42314.1 STAS domain-containing protein [Nocardioides sp. cx-173]
MGEQPHGSQAPPPLDVGVEEHGAHRVVALRGEVDMASVGAVRTCLRELMLAGHTDVLVDLRDVTFMDSTGLGVLVAARKQARVFRGSLGLVAPSPPVARVLSLTSLDRVFPCFGSLDEALAPEPSAS